MIKEFRLPDLGEGLTESEILSWKVAVGDTVALNQVIAEVETAKAVVELPSPFAGVITALHEQPGTVVEVGKPIVSFEVEGDDGGPSAAGPAAAETAKREPNLVGYGAVVEGSGRPARRARTFASPVVEPAPGPTAAETTATVEPVETRAPAASAAPAAAAERPRSTPPVRKLAKDLGVELTAVAGTGAGGLITRDDVRNFVGGETFPLQPGPWPGRRPRAAPQAASRESGKHGPPSRVSAN